MHRYTVTWKESAEARLADYWNENPAVRQEIADAADFIDRTLAVAPHAIGLATSDRGRYVVRVPVAALYVPHEDDRQIHVVLVKLWDE